MPVALRPGLSEALSHVHGPPQTPKEDLHSKLGMDLKRAMLLRLARRETQLYPQDPVKRDMIYSKYKVGPWVRCTQMAALPTQCFVHIECCVFFWMEYQHMFWLGSHVVSSSLRSRRRRPSGWGWTWRRQWRSRGSWSTRWRSPVDTPPVTSHTALHSCQTKQYLYNTQKPLAKCFNAWSGHFWMKYFLVTGGDSKCYLTANVFILRYVCICNVICNSLPAWLHKNHHSSLLDANFYYCNVFHTLVRVFLV